ncbi:S-layer homology domain-containing protein [Salsuginibacillus kocurii]|uniref:S-layer homology domain-containing protein n=1 Tax=Salsuginibacillus kocurii TaxID=427078 RepID=UPI00036B79F4|nr:S-layer homology domain-containing protein [Salsuginibacillus kocurii]
MKRKWTTGAVLAFFLSATILAPAHSNAETEYSDVDADFWGYEEIDYLTGQGIIEGSPDGTFSPNNEVSRADAAIMMARSLDLETTDRPNPGFNDMSEDHYAYYYAAAVADEGVISGTPDGNYLPDEPLERGQMAALIDRAFELGAGSADYEFADVDENNPYYSSIDALAANQISIGYKGGGERVFEPGQSTTRAEFSTFLARVFDESFRPGEDEESPDSFSELAEDYRVFEDYDTDGPATGLGEGKEFLASVDGAWLVRGHQGHALGHYAVMQMDEEEEEVIETHRYTEEDLDKYTEIRDRLEEEDAEDVLRDLLEEEENSDEPYFVANVPPETTTVTYQGEEVEAIETEFEEETYRYFKEDVGLIKVRYASDLVIDTFGEEQIAERHEEN